ncbi:hypothetical protein [Gordonia sp. (in: high G+C Gram-positive bacteria)]|uniref:hypothetical protein n=1 Tax=Gordonia sp. (in: high G+C Gram-positive bacteria) TaxID=84139 RepID=UPI0033424380
MKKWIAATAAVIGVATLVSCGNSPDGRCVDEVPVGAVRAINAGMTDGSVYNAGAIRDGERYVVAADLYRSSYGEEVGVWTLHDMGGGSFGAISSGNTFADKTSSWPSIRSDEIDAAMSCPRS